MKNEQKYVLIFDFCSSTSVLEHLIQNGRDAHWRNLLIDIKDFLQTERKTHGFEIYKFIGDGWILFFPKTFPSAELFSFMKRLCERYLAVFKSGIRPVASRSFDNGITFGLAEGSVIRFRMNRQDEYFGWPINLAARLQGAIGGKDDRAPQNKVLMTKPAYHDLKGAISRTYRIATVQRTLKNIAAGESCKYIKLSLYEKPHAKKAVNK